MEGHFTTTEGHTIIYSGGDVQGQRGIAVWIHKKIAGTLLEYQTVNDRILAIEINAKIQQDILIFRTASKQSKFLETLRFAYQEFLF